MSGRKAWDWLNSTEPSNVVVPGLESYHIKGDIILSQMYSWSSTTEPGKDGPEAWIVTFANGTKVKVDVRAQDGRTLCVREE